MYDLIIIGSGPAGLSAAVYAKRSGLDLVVLEKAPMSGGQVLNTYEVDNYLGMPGINGFDMGMQFRGHADKLGVTFLEAEVTAVEDRGNRKLVHTTEGELETRTIILATGAVHAKLNVPGEEELLGMGVSYCATCDGAFFKGKRVAVVGGGNSALEDAIYLAALCEKVYLIHRRDAFRGAEILQEELKALLNVEIITNHVVEEIRGENHVQEVVVKDVRDAKKQTLEVAGVFAAVGIRPCTDLVKELLKCDDSGYVLAGEDCVTSVPGIYAAGDIRRKLARQIVTAVADGANAAISAGAYCKEVRKD